MVKQKIGSVVQKFHLALWMLAFRPALKEVATYDAVRAKFEL
jgi:hypothetical protein